MAHHRIHFERCKISECTETMAALDAFLTSGGELVLSGIAIGRTADGVLAIRGLTDAERGELDEAVALGYTADIENNLEDIDATESTTKLRLVDKPL